MTDPGTDPLVPDDVQDRLAVLRAGVDQARAASGELAAMMGSYFHGLLLQGFERAEAQELVLAFQDWFLGREGEAPDEDSDDE